MNYYLFIGIALLIVIVLTVGFFVKRRRVTSPQQSKTYRLRELIDRGVVYEDDFIQMYLKLLRDEGFLRFFGKQQGRAHIVMTKLMEESTEHKRALADVKARLT